MQNVWAQAALYLQLLAIPSKAVSASSNSALTPKPARVSPVVYDLNYYDVRLPVSPHYGVEEPPEVRQVLHVQIFEGVHSLEVVWDSRLSYDLPVEAISKENIPEAPRSFCDREGLGVGALFQLIKRLSSGVG